MKNIFEKIKISGISAVIPKNKISLDDFYHLWDQQKVEKTYLNTGIKTVRAAKEAVKSSDLAICAANILLDNMNISPTSIDGIICVSQTPDFKVPATSIFLQNKLGMSKDALALDLNYGCSGYIHGLFQAAMLINTGSCNRVLICAGDVISKLLHPNERQTKMVLSDASSATIVESGINKLFTIIKTDGSGFEYLFATQDYYKDYTKVQYDGFFHLNGAKIVEFSLREIPKIIDEIIEFSGIKKSEVDIYALHQPNVFMLDALIKKCNIPAILAPCAIEHIGNTGSASIPVVLCTHYANKTALKDVIMCGFGSGFSWGATLINMSDAKIFPLYEI